MELGIIGLGKMGGNMAQRLVKGGHKVVAYARTAESVAAAVSHGATGASSVEDLVSKLKAPRIAWMMVPSGDATEETLTHLLSLLSPNDIIIDGGNSNFHDSMRRAKLCQTKQINFVDVGTSGGVWGLTEGYSMMIGGEKKAVDQLRPIFETLAPAKDKGWGHVGPSGSGHYVKMIHNGIEYGIMQAFAEGFDLMNHRTEFNINLPQVADIWRTGSVVRSWLLDLTADALRENPKLEGIAPYVVDSGEGRWTVVESIDQSCPTPVITIALQKRFMSRDKNSFADRLLSAMRNKFGGHDVKKA